MPAMRCWSAAATGPKTSARWWQSSNAAAARTYCKRLTMITKSAISPTIFREYDIRGLVDQDLTEEACHLVGQGLGTLVHQAGGKSVVVGRDCRLSGPRFARAFISGMIQTGIDVVDLGVL